MLFRKSVKIGRLFLNLKVSNSLWFDSLKDQKGKCVKLAGIGYYEREPFKSKLYSITLLYLSLQFAWISKED